MSTQDRLAKARARLASLTETKAALATDEPWVTLKVIAAHLEMHPQTAWTKARNGDIPGHQLNGKGKWRFRISEVDAALRGEPVYAQSAQSRGRKRT